MITDFLFQRAKQPCEDTPQGWKIAIEEAFDYATTAFAHYQYVAWVDGRDVR
jgi:hypothetical protein